MQRNDGVHLELSTRVNQLFASVHAFADPEQSVEDVARSVSVSLDRTVGADEITALRTGVVDNGSVDRELLAALARHFKVDEEYLTGTADQAASVHSQLVFMAAARDARVRHLDLRGSEMDINELAELLSRLSKNNPSSPDQPT